MENPSSSHENTTIGCGNPNRVLGDGDYNHTLQNAAGDRDQRLQQLFPILQNSNAPRNSSAGGWRDSVCVDPLTFARSGRQPMQTDFFLQVALFHAHFGLEQERLEWAEFLPEYLRPGNLEKYLKQTKKPQLFGNNFWWVSRQSSEQELQSCFRGYDHIRYSRDQLLQLREVIAVPNDVLKIKQDMEAEFRSVKQITEHRATSRDCKVVEEDRDANIKVDLPGALKNGDFQDKEKEANISVNAMQEEPKTGEEAKQEDGILEKKKEKTKRGSISKERKAKKKIEKRKKRAEKNRKLGVKRLKIQPILKPKTVSHCRHYLKGRCYEGEKCKFSHDIVPLTKSKPCCHFARQACMKGDDCPFDHDLSKYPCNNYVSTGFCHRRESCLFSHEITPKQDSISTTGIVKPEMKSSNPSPKAHSVQQTNNALTLDGTPRQRTAKAAVGIGTMNKPAQEPKGLSFLSSGSLPLHNGAEHKQANVSQKPHFIFEAGAPQTENSSSKLLSFQGTSKGTPALRARSSALPDSFKCKQQVNIDMKQSSGLPTVKNFKDNEPTSMANQPVKTPRGLSFLNFGNLQMNGSTKDKQAGLSQKASNGAEACVLQNQGTSSYVSKPSKESRAPSVPTSNSADNFIFGKSSLHNQEEKNQPSLPTFGNSNLVASASEKKDTTVAPFKLPVSPSSPGPFLTRLDNVQMKNTSSSAQRALLSTLAFASGVSGNSFVSAPVFGADVNKNQGSSSAGTSSASADASKNGGADQKKPASASEVWEMLYGGGSKSKP